LFRQWLENNGGNRVVIALSFARLGDAIGNSVLFIVIPLIVTKLPSPAFPFPESVRVGFLIAWYGIVNTLLQPVMGAWSDRLGLRKPLIQIGLVIMGIGTLAFLAAGRFIDLLLLRSLQGVGVAITVPAALAMIASSSVKETRGGSMGIYTTMRMLGLIIGPLIGGFLVDNFTLSINFVAAAGFIFVAIFLVQIWVRETPPDRSRTKGQRFQIIDRKLINPGILGASCATLIMASAFTMSWASASLTAPIRSAGFSSRCR
jgi:MFS family permease